MKKLLFTAIALLFLFSPVVAGAQVDIYSNNPDSTNVPTWNPQKSGINSQTAEVISKFRYYHVFNKLYGSIPQVVEVALPTSGLVDKSKFALIEAATDSLQPFEITIKDQKPIFTILNLSENSNSTVQLAPMHDENSTTYSQFQISPSGSSEVTLRFVYSSPVTTSNLYLMTAEFSDSPKTFSLSIKDPGKEEVIIADKPLSGDIRFTSHTASVWELKLHYSQPLRISEAYFVPDTAYAQNAQYMRFLMRPGSQYILYSNPDGYVGYPNIEGGNLYSANQIITLSLPIETPNPAYRATDADKDGIPDTTDNCPSVSNKDQLDKNNNGMGDACEDFDHDGVLNYIDNCPDVPNRDQRDTDVDKKGDYCDDEESRLTEKLTYLPWLGIILGFGVVIGMFAITVKKPTSTTEKKETMDNSSK